jgi:hypothetical protein
MLVRLSQIVLRVHLPNKNLNKEFVIFTVQNHITEITMALWMAFLNQVNEPGLVYTWTHKHHILILKQYQKPQNLLPAPCIKEAL